MTHNSSISVSINQLQQLLTRAEKIKWLIIVSFAFFSSFLEVITASVIVVFAQVMNVPETGLKYLNKIGLSNDLSDGRIIAYIAIIVGVVYLVKNIIATLEVFFQNFTIQNMNYNFKNKLLKRYSHIDYGFYLTRNSSLGIQIVGSDAEKIFSGAMVAFAGILSEAIIFIALIGMIIYMNPSLAFFIFAIIGIISLSVSKGLLPRFYKFGQKFQEFSMHSSQNLLQFFHGFKEIVLLGKRDYFAQSYKVYELKKSRIQALQTSFNVLPRIVIEILFVGLFVITVAFLCADHENPAQIMGILGGYLYAGFRLMPGLNRMITHLNMFKSSIASVNRICEEYNFVTSKQNYENVEDFKFSEKIIIKDLCFRYLNTQKDALSKICLQIKKGETIGIVGETGSGKSTLVDIILGLLKPYDGTILVDDKYPVSSYQWHQKIGYVPQSVYLIDDRIEKNIAFGEEEINLERLNHAIDAAQLRKFIDNLPDGAKTIVGERGIRLSGGERQRIAIARAIYRNPEVLIFDEATSALDNETERLLMETINMVSKDRTVIMIAHRLTTLKNCDRIVVMEKGRIKEVTNYEKLWK